MLNYKLVVERTLHVETPRGLALLSVGDEVFLKLHGYGWLFGTIIALGHDTMLVAGHDLDESKRVAYRWITDVRDTAPDLCPVSAHGVCHSSAVYGICGGRDGGRQRDIRHVYRPTLAHRIVCRNRKNGFGIFSELTKGGNNEKQMENSRHCNAWRGDYRILCLVVVTPGQ